MLSQLPSDHDGLIFSFLLCCQLLCSKCLACCELFTGPPLQIDTALGLPTAQDGDPLPILPPRHLLLVHPGPLLPHLVPELQAAATSRVAWAGENPETGISGIRDQ